MVGALGTLLVLHCTIAERLDMTGDLKKILGTPRMIYGSSDMGGFPEKIKNEHLSARIDAKCP